MLHSSILRHFNYIVRRQTKAKKDSVLISIFDLNELSDLKWLSCGEGKAPWKVSLFFPPFRANAAVPHDRLLASFIEARVEVERQVLCWWQIHCDPETEPAHLTENPEVTGHPSMVNNIMFIRTCQLWGWWFQRWWWGVCHKLRYAECRCTEPTVNGKQLLAPPINHQLLPTINHHHLSTIRTSTINHQPLSIHQPPSTIHPSIIKHQPSIH